jgi:hypothetical protein
MGRKKSSSEKQKEKQPKIPIEHDSKHESDQEHEITEDDINLDDDDAPEPEIEYEVKDGEIDEEDLELSGPQYQIIQFFDVQHAINSLIDYLNQSIEEIIISFSRSDQKLFSHDQKKLIMNAVLESGFYDYCKERLKGLLTDNQEKKMNEEEMDEIMEELQEEIQLLAYILVNNRLVHRTLNFDLYLSLLKGGLFVDILAFNVSLMDSIQENREKDMDFMNKKHKKINVKEKYSFYI